MITNNLCRKLFYHNAGLIQNRDFDEIHLDDAFRKENEFFVVDVFADVVAQPVFIVKAKSLLINGFDKLVALAINNRDHVPQG